MYNIPEYLDLRPLTWCHKDKKELLSCCPEMKEELSIFCLCKLEINFIFAGSDHLPNSLQNVFCSPRPVEELSSLDLLAEWTMGSGIVTGLGWSVRVSCLVWGVYYPLKYIITCNIKVGKQTYGETFWANYL